MEKDKDSKLENEILQTEGLGETLHGINRYVHKLESMQNAIFETSLDPPGSNTEKTTLDNKISAAKAYIKREFGSISKKLGTFNALTMYSEAGSGSSIAFTVMGLFSSLQNNATVANEMFPTFGNGSDPSGYVQLGFALFKYNSLPTLANNVANSLNSQTLSLICGLSAIGFSAAAAFANGQAHKYKIGQAYFSDVWRRLKSYEKKLKASGGIPVYNRVQRP